MNKIKILVEGKSDIDFISSFLDFLGKKEMVDFDIYECNGNTNIKSYIEAANLRECEKILIIFDADSDAKASKQNIEKQLKNIEVSCKIEIFLLPNNESSGDLETLLVNIAKHKEVLACFDNYKKCIENKVDIIEGLQLPQKKSKWFAYKEAFGLSKDNYFKIANYLDYNSAYLNDLKNFLRNAFKDNK